MYATASERVCHCVRVRKKEWELERGNQFFKFTADRRSRPRISTQITILAIVSFPHFLDYHCTALQTPPVN